MLNHQKNIDKLWWTVFILNWVWQLPPEQKKTWSCDWCKSKKLQEQRNCHDRFQKTNIRLTGKTFVQQCPISMIDSMAVQVYEIANYSFSGGMGGVGFLPSDLLNEPNIWFEYKSIVNDAEHRFKEETENGKH